MLDMPLGYELAFLIIISAGIAWLMGRAFCKSKEHQVQADLNDLQTQYDHLEALMKQKDHDLQHATEQLHALDQQYVALKHTHETDTTLLQRLQQERKTIVAQLQDLELYRVKFEHLNKKHDEHAKDLLDLNTLHNQTQDELKHKNKQISQQKQQLQQEADNTSALEQTFAAKKATLATTIAAKDTQITALIEDKKRLENKAQQQIAAKEAIIQQAENDKQTWQASHADQQQQQAQLIQQLRDTEAKMTALQHQYQHKVQYHDKVQQKKSALQLRHQKQIQKVSALTTELQQQNQTLTNKDALIKRLQQENQTLSLLNQQNSVKIDTLNKEINVYWQTVNATNHRISGMLKNIPTRN